MAGEDYFLGWDPSSLSPEEMEQAKQLAGAEATHQPIGTGVPTGRIPDTGFQPPSTDQARVPTREEIGSGVGLAGALIASGGVGMATGGMSVPFQVGAQLLAGTGASVFNQLVSGEAQEKSWRDILTDARSEGFLWGGVTGLGAISSAASRIANSPLVADAVSTFKGTAPGRAIDFVRDRLDNLERMGGVRTGASRLLRERLGYPTQRVQLPGASGLNARYSNVLQEGGEAAERFALEHGTTLPLGNVVRSKFVDMAQNIATSALTGSRIEKLTLANERVFQKEVRNLINKFPRLSPQDTGRVVTDLTRGGHGFRGTIAEGHYQMVDDALQPHWATPHDVRVPAGERLGDLGGARATYMNNPQYPAQPPVITQYGVDIKGLKADARNVVQLYGKESTEGVGAVIPGEVRAILEKPDMIPWAEAHRLRSALFSLSQQFERGTTEISPVLKGRATLLSGNLTHAMENAASKAPREVRDALTTANRIWREEMHGSYETVLAKKLADEQPFDVMKALLSTRNPDDVRAMRALIAKGAAGRAQETMGAEALRGAGKQVQDETFEKVQGSFIQHLLNQTSEEVVLPGGAIANYRTVSPVKLAALIDEVGKDSKGELFKAWGVEKQINHLRDIANFGKLNAEGAGGGKGATVFFQLTQAQALGTGAGLLLAFSDNYNEAAVPTMAAFALAPIAVNRLFSDPTLVKWLTIGGVAPPRTRLASKVILMTLGKMAQNGMLSSDQDPAARQKIEAAQRHLGMPVTGNLGTEPRLSEEERAQVEGLLTQDMGQHLEDRVMSKDRSSVDARENAQRRMEEIQQQLKGLMGGK